MNEELEQAVQTETITAEETATERRLEGLPRYEDMVKSETEVAPANEIKGLTEVESQTKIEDKPFTRVEDKKKVYLKRRLKIVTAVYLSIVALLMIFTIANVATLVALNKKITDNTNTIQAESSVVEVLQKEEPEAQAMTGVEISLNEPRDYSEDYKDLTFFDKISILFRNLFG